MRDSEQSLFEKHILTYLVKEFLAVFLKSKGMWEFSQESAIEI
jgi:hypothetical protein